MFIAVPGIATAGTAKVGNAIIIMNAEEQNQTQAELNELIRKASEKAVVSKQDPELVRLVDAIKANLELAKRAVREVGVAGYQKHLEAVGYACPIARLKRGLAATGLWRPKPHKGPVKPAPRQ